MSPNIVDSVGVRFQILGPVRLWRDGAELDAGPPQQVYLLALLLARAGRPVGTPELIDLIWGDDAPATARNVVQKYVGALRRILEPGLPARNSGSFLHRRGDAYLFTAGPDMLDLAAFREHVALGDYGAALDLWRGPAGGGLGPATIFTSLDEEFFHACTAAAAHAVAGDRPERVLPGLRLAASMAPFHEPVQAGLVAVLGAAGRQAEALAVFRTVRERLAEELGIDPGPALVEAHRRVLAPPERGAPVTRRSGLVGRADELAVLRQVLGGAPTGIGVIEGEPGAGKTRLLREIAAEAEGDGTLVVWGSCLEGDGTPAMWPWEQALGAIVASLPAPDRAGWLTGEAGAVIAPREGAWDLPGENAQFRLFEQVVALVGRGASRRRTLLILDDLQWADAASLQLFHHLAGRLPGGTAMIVALRDRAPTVSTAVSRALAAVSRLPGHHRVRLGPLGPADVAALVRDESGADPGDDVAHAIHVRSAGNPFFVRELARLLTESGEAGLTGVPSTVRDVVRDRMAGLGDRARDLVHVAALIGRDVDLRLLSRAGGVGVADCLNLLEPLHALGLLEYATDDPSALRFAHDLVRESVTETTPKQQAVRGHLRVADALEHVHADDEVVTEQLAYHLWAAGPLAEPARTAEALIRAGRCAATKLAFGAAVRHLRSAVRVACTSGLMEQELAALTLLAVVVRRQSGYDASTVDLLERAEYLAGALGRDDEAADFLFIRMMGAFTAMEKDRGRLALRMRDLGRDSTDPAVQQYGRLAWGLHQWDIGRIGAAYRAFTTEPAGGPDRETPLRRDGSIPGEGPGWRAVTTALHGDVAAALAVVDGWDVPGDPYAASVWVYYTTMIASMAGDAGTAHRAGQRWAAEGLDRLGAQIGHYVRQCRCWARALTGDDPAGAAAEAEELLAAGLLDPPQWGAAYHHGLIAEMWLAAGRLDRAADALDRAGQAMGDHGQRYAEGLLLLLQARLAQARGEPVAVVRAAAVRAQSFSAASGAHLFARRAERWVAEL